MAFFIVCLLEHLSFSRKVFFRSADVFKSMSESGEGGIMKQEKAVVVFSGGQDSTTCLLWALQQFEEVETVTFHYNQRHQQEIEVAGNIAGKLGVKNHLLDMALLNQLTPNALTRDDIEIEAKEGELPSTFVPGRNLVFLSFASILAYQIGARHIVTGVCETDFSGYPDCRDEFVKSCNVTVNLAMEAAVCDSHMRSCG